MSATSLRRTLIVLAAIGIAVAAYLTYIHYADIKPICTTGGCEQVQSSAYAKLVGIPVALLGLIGYIAIMGSLLLAESENSRLLTMLLVLVGWGFSMYLTYREIFTIHAICQWCVSSATILTIMAILSVWRFLRGDVPAPAPSTAPAAADDGA